VAHSITLVALFSSPWTSETRGSSGRCGTGAADLTEKSVPATLATSLADELDSHVNVVGWFMRTVLTLFADFFLFNAMKSLSVAGSL
jgi:hypothetical protein